MGAIGIVLLVAFVIVCVFSILLVLVQDKENSGMGGMLGGGNSTAFGSHSADVLTKTTVVFVVLFFVTAFALAFINKKSSAKDDLAGAAAEAGMISDKSSEATADWWKNDKTVESTETVVEPSKTENVPTTEAVVETTTTETQNVAQ